MNDSAAVAPRRRNTWQREAVRDALHAQGGFVTAQDLHRRLEASGQRIGLATVYRALGTLVEIGDADTIRADEGDLYSLCEVTDHHHHIVCRRCGFAEEIEDDVVEAWAAKVGTEHGFTEVTHVLEIFGLCERCAANNS